MTTTEAEYEAPAAWARRFWRRWRGLIAVALLVIVIGVGYGLASTGGSGVRLDPESARPDGGRALATLLKERGVETEKVQRFDTASETLRSEPGGTLLLTSPNTLTREQRDQLADIAADHVVLLEPGEDALRSFTSGVYPAGEAFGTVREPDCSLQAARLAGPVTVSGPMYRGADIGRAHV